MFLTNISKWVPNERFLEASSSFDVSCNVGGKKISFELKGRSQKLTDLKNPAQHCPYTPKWLY